MPKASSEAAALRAQAFLASAVGLGRCSSKPVEVDFSKREKLSMSRFTTFGLTILLAFAGAIVSAHRRDFDKGE